jgi:hypothetical protein
LGGIERSYDGETVRCALARRRDDKNHSTKTTTERNGGVFKKAIKGLTKAILGVA